MPRSALAGRLRRLEEAQVHRCPACAGRPPLPDLLFRYEGRLTDGRGRDVSEAELEPCAACGRGGPSDGGGVRLIVGIDPACL